MSLSSTSQQPVPFLNIIPDTPARPLLAMPSPKPSLLQPNKFFNFTISNPLPNPNNNSHFPKQPLPARSAGTLGPGPQQPLVANAQVAVGNHGEVVQPIQNSLPPAKRSRTGMTRMRPSKTSTTPRNLCALEWAVSHPKGTTDEFSTYYDGLSAQEKEKWERLLVEAKESGKTDSNHNVI